MNGDLPKRKRNQNAKNIFTLNWGAALSHFDYFFLKCHFKQWVNDKQRSAFKKISLETINFWMCEEMYAGRLHLFCWKALTATPELQWENN